jgi:hypothetical protein
MPRALPARTVGADRTPIWSEQNATAFPQLARLDQIRVEDVMHAGLMGIVSDVAAAAAGV